MNKNDGKTCDWRIQSLKLLLLIGFLYCPFVPLFGQNHFTHQDTLRGSITPERAWWDLQYYHLDIKVNPKDSTVAGTVTIKYKVLSSNNIMQVDLQPPLKIYEVRDTDGNVLEVRHEGNAHFVRLAKSQKAGMVDSILVQYGGSPKVAVRPPWDGGISWEKDPDGVDIVHTNCQGIGASIWWPNKDHLYDEPDSVLISVNVPANLMNVSNGRLRNVENLKDGTKTYHWFVSNPISNYVININIANYVHFSEVFKGEKGNLTMDYFVFPRHLEKAKKQFQDAPRMMEAFEYWFGPYPFYEDGYKLVEVTSTGMEHQSSVTYGNGFENGYRGRDGSGTGWGFKFDFIIIHESGHEWFANNITYRDVADMWIHESFTNYSESLFLDYHYGKEAGQEYVRGNRQGIRNDKPIIGIYGVNQRGSGDMYVKGGNILNTLREVIDDDQKWRQILRGLNKTFYHQTVTTEQIEYFISNQTGINLQPFFDQYLRDVRIPTLEYLHQNGKLSYRWSNCVDDFDMPVKVQINGAETWLKPVSKWNSMDHPSKLTIFKIDPDFYVGSMNLLGE